jgi:hypothetical protein
MVLTVNRIEPLSHILLVFHKIQNLPSLMWLLFVHQLSLYHLNRGLQFYLYLWLICKLDCCHNPFHILQLLWRLSKQVWPLKKITLKAATFNDAFVLTMSKVSRWFCSSFPYIQRVVSVHWPDTKTRENWIGTARLLTNTYRATCSLYILVLNIIHVNRLTLLVLNCRYMLPAETLSSLIHTSSEINCII